MEAAAPIAMISRRTFLHTLPVALLGLPMAEAQQSGKVARVGYLHAGNYVPIKGMGLDALRPGLRDFGWIEGRTVIIESRFAGQQAEKLSAYARELVQIPVDILVTVGTAATQAAAKKATSTIPIVMFPVGDPVEAGFVTSLGRPGGNITGISLNNVDVAAKRLQILKEAVPNATRVGLVVNEASPDFTSLQVKATKKAALQLGMTIDVIGVRDPSELEKALTKSRRVDALVIVPDTTFTQKPGQIAGLALRQRLPATMDLAEFAHLGGLLATSPDYAELYRRGVSQVDKILRGAKASELPVEQPTRYDVTLNLKTAKALGLTIPPSLMLRADTVIQ
jgi:putative tryptophan/tyrosine transport system substrate-binding protein